jgi:hypothetical protein
VTVGADRLGRWVDGFADRHGSFAPDVTATLVTLTAADGSSAAIEVPFPPLHGNRLTDLLVHVHRDRVVGVLLVRRAGFAVGVFEGRALVASKVDSTYVQGTTKAGGSSQQRYARRRANQAVAAFGEAADTAVRVLGGAQLDALIAGGDRGAVRTVLADPRLRALPEPTGPWLQVKDPKKRMLEAMPDQFLAVRISLSP